MARTEDEGAKPLGPSPAISRLLTFLHHGRDWHSDFILHAMIDVGVPRTEAEGLGQPPTPSCPLM